MIFHENNNVFMFSLNPTEIYFARFHKNDFYHEITSTRQVWENIANIKRNPMILVQIRENRKLHEVPILAKIEHFSENVRFSWK